MNALLRRCRHLAVALLVGLALVRPAAAVDYSDIWWNPAESGWGVNFINADNFIFATFFVYGNDQQPTWVTAQLTQNANNVWTGPLYFTTGSYYGVPWNPAQSTVVQVGTATFAPFDSATGTLSYTVGQVAVTKSITRQTLKLIPAGGNYSGAVTSVYSGCNNPDLNGPLTYFANLVVNQTTNSLQLNFTGFRPSDGSAFSFVMGGAAVQQGLLYQMPGATYAIGNFTFSANVTELKVTAQGIEGRWSANLNSGFPGCVENANFSLLWIFG